MPKTKNPSQGTTGWGGNFATLEETEQPQFGEAAHHRQALHPRRLDAFMRDWLRVSPIG
jgi:hypothetical protein